MKKSHFISLLTGIIIIFGVIALQAPGHVAASEANRQLLAVTLTPSEVPADTNTPEPPPSNTPEPDPPTSTPEPGEPTATSGPNTPVPTARPNPGGRGNLGLVSFWVFIGGLSVALIAMLAVPFVRDAVVNAGIFSPTANPVTDSFLPTKFVRRWLVILAVLMVLGTFLGYILANFM